MALPPKDSKAEATAALLKGALGAVPFAGGLMAELANLYLNPLEKRKQYWMQEVGEAIIDLQNRLGLLPESLQDNESFISFLYQATHIAIRNHQEDKIKALKKSIISAAEFPAVEDDLKFQFLRYVDELGVLHLRLLGCFHENHYEFSSLDNMEDMLKKAESFVGKDLDRSQFRTYMQDLASRSLILITDIKDLPEFASRNSSLLLNDSSLQPFCVTALGESFLGFIRASEH